MAKKLPCGSSQFSVPLRKAGSLVSSYFSPLFTEIEFVWEKVKLFPPLISVINLGVIRFDKLFAETSMLAVMPSKIMKIKDLTVCFDMIFSLLTMDVGYRCTMFIAAVQ
jgi:hypothetical protein